MCYAGVAIQNGPYGTGNSSSFISNVACSGNESRLTDCTYDNTRLTDNMTESEGRVEICIPMALEL